MTTVARNTTIVAAADCPCIDSSQVLLPRSNCIREDGSSGVWVADTMNGACFPLSYGANECAPHDMQVDPRCSMADDPPDYCKKSFCFIDSKACKLSTESYYRSSLPVEDELYYSYSTCGSAEDSWLDFLSTNQLDGIKLTVTVPALLFPNHYKMSETAKANDLTDDAYYNDTVPWKGWQLDYFSTVAGISNLREVAYTHNSRGSDAKSPNSRWTAAVHDVQAGISCLAVSNFWITTERLKLTMFTAPITTEKLYLFIPSPVESSETTFAENVQKTLAPFESNLWFLIVGLLVVVALLSVVFARKDGDLSVFWERMRSQEWKKASYLRRALMFLKIGFESILLKSTHAMTHSAGVNMHNSLAQKLINAGFAFLVLILISAYTANLAAFLTVSLAEQVGYIQDMKDVVAKGVTVCGYFALKDDLSRIWPTANILYFDHSSEMVEAYDYGKCVAIIESQTNAVTVRNIMSNFCNRNLVMTGPPVLEMPIGFPVCKDFAAGISHWIYKAEKQGITYESYEEQNMPQQLCSFDLPEETRDNEMAKLTVEDFALPIVAMMVCIALAILSHIWDRKTRKDENKSDDCGHGYSSGQMEQPTLITERDSFNSTRGITAQQEKLDSTTTEIENMLDETKRMVAVLEKIAEQRDFMKDVYV